MQRLELEEQSMFTRRQKSRSEFSAWRKGVWPLKRLRVSEKNTSGPGASTWGRATYRMEHINWTPDSKFVIPLQPNKNRLDHWPHLENQHSHLE